MTTYGSALEALADFRADLQNAQSNAPQPSPYAASAFRTEAVFTPEAFGVHATGVGIRDEGSPEDFVIKVFVFDAASRDAAVGQDLFRRPRQGVEVDVSVLPTQRPLPSVRSSVALHRARHRPAPGGVEIGPLGGPYVGTLGCFVRGSAESGSPLFVLSNNHVLANVNRFSPGTPFAQPGSSSPADVICQLTAFVPIAFPSPGLAPRNTMDAAIAAVVDATQAKLGTQLGIRRYTPTLRAPRPGMRVIKAGRTTGVTRGIITATLVRGLTVNYGSPTVPLVATFDNVITISGVGGKPFGKPGDSGSVILDETTRQPVALLFAGDPLNTDACDLTAVCARFGVSPC